MQCTELLVTGYDGEEVVFAVNLVPNASTVVLTHADENGVTVVDTAWSQATDAFAAARELMVGLVRAPARASS